MKVYYFNIIFFFFLMKDLRENLEGNKVISREQETKRDKGRNRVGPIGKEESRLLCARLQWIMGTERGSHAISPHKSQQLPTKIFPYSPFHTTKPTCLLSSRHVSHRAAPKLNIFISFIINIFIFFNIYIYIYIYIYINNMA